MNYTAQNIKSTEWLVTAHEGGSVVWQKKIFLPINNNTESKAIEVATFVGDEEDM